MRATPWKKRLQYQDLPMVVSFSRIGGRCGSRRVWQRDQDVIVLELQHEHPCGELEKMQIEMSEVEAEFLVTEIKEYIRYRRQLTGGREFRVGKRYSKDA